MVVVTFHACCCASNAPPSSLMDSTVSPKLKTAKEKELGRAPQLAALRGQKGVLNFKMGLGRLTSNPLTHTDLHKPSNKLVSVRWSTLVHERTKGKHGLTKLTTARTWGKSPPSPLQYTLCLATGLTPKCHFVPGLPSGNPKIPKVGTPATLGAHDFVCKPSIEMKSKAQLQPSSKAFQWYVARHLHTRKSG